MPGDSWVVITSINPPTHAVEVISDLVGNGWSAVVVGDKKTPPDWKCGGIQYLDLDAQRELFPSVADLLPFGHYSRKNIGYLYAISQGATAILDTDDDNIPKECFTQGIQKRVNGRLVGGADWINIYSYFTDENIWPRGLPLDEIRERGKILESEVSKECLVQQFLADLDPDIDAIHRLVFASETSFREESPAILNGGAWCPFNSQNTVFYEEAFPLLYLPSFVSFRMTDIWRSFVALALLQRAGEHVAFASATVDQIRNEHDLIKDFADEIPGYLNNKKIKTMLTAAANQIAPSEALRPKSVIRCLTSLVAGEIMKEQEIILAQAWLDQLEAITGS